MSAPQTVAAQLAEAQDNLAVVLGAEQRGGVMLKAHRVQIHRRQVGVREFDGITVYIADLRLSCDLMNDRQIRLAHELATQHQAFFMYDDVNAERVKAALKQGEEV